MTYKITSEILKQHAHLSDEEIERDIADTQREVDHLRVQVAAYNELRWVGPEHERKMAAFRCSGAMIGIEERLAFIRKLQALLDARKVAPQADPEPQGQRVDSYKDFVEGTNFTQGTENL